MADTKADGPPALDGDYIAALLAKQPKDYKHKIVGGAHKYMILGPVGEPGAYGSGWTAVDLKPPDGELWHAVATVARRDEIPLRLLTDAVASLAKFDGRCGEVLQAARPEIVAICTGLARDLQRWAQARSAPGSPRGGAVSSGSPPDGPPPPPAPARSTLGADGASRAKRLLVDLVLLHMRTAGFSPTARALRTAFSLTFLLHRLGDTVYLLSKFAGRRMVSSPSGLHVFVKKLVFLKTYKAPAEAYPAGEASKQVEASSGIPDGRSKLGALTQSRAKFSAEVAAELALARRLIAERPPVHPNVVRYLDVQIDAPVLTRDKRPTGERCCFLVTELAEDASSLQSWVAAQFTACYYSDFLEKNPKYTLSDVRAQCPGAKIEAALDDPRVARHFMRELLKAVASMHACGVYHYDIKPENVMIDGEKRLRLMDFGLGAVVHAHGREEARRGHCAVPTATDKLGTAPAYMAPEVRRAKKGSRVLAGPQDVWGCGNSLVKLTCMRQMFGYVYERHKRTGKAPEFIALEVSLAAYRRKYPRLEERFDPRRHADGPMLEDLVAKMMDPDPRSRPTAAEALEHPWMHFGLLPQDVQRMSPEGPMPSTAPFRPGEPRSAEDRAAAAAAKAASSLEGLIAAQEPLSLGGDAMLAERLAARFGAGGGGGRIDWTDVVRAVRTWDRCM